jgi:hypothetical protein
MSWPNKLERFVVTVKVIKHFLFVHDTGKKAGALILNEYFQPTLTFASAVLVCQNIMQGQKYITG